MRGNLWQTVVIALALALLLPLFLNGAFGNAASQYNASESTVVDYESDYAVAEDAYAYNQSITIVQNGSELDAGSDYSWDADAGVVDWLENGSADEGSETTIDYQYRDHSERTTLVAWIFEMNAAWIGLLLLIVAMGFLKVFAIGSGGF